MSEKIGCMNCGNISCKNNKKRESKGCGRWKTPEQRILELEEKVGMAERTRDRLISIGFPTFASCKEYAAKLAELEKENAELKEKYVKNITDCDICDTYCNSQLNNAKEIINDCVCELQNILFYKMRNKERIASTLDKAEQFLRESK